MPHTKKLAVLIDADNISADAIEHLLLEINKFGIASVKRIYGDWTDNKLNKWKNILLKFGINPIQQFSYTSGKNATDMAMAIDAMDLLYSKTFDGFCLVSSDSDFTRLASRIRESGLEVLGFGQQKTPEAFVKACDKFTYIELLLPTKVEKLEPNTTIAPEAATLPIVTAAKKNNGDLSSNNTTKTQNNIPKVSRVNSSHPYAIKPLIKKALEAHANDDGWVKLANIGTYLTQVKPDFDVRSFGHDKLSGLIKSMPKDFEIQLQGSVFTIRSKTTVSETPPQRFNAESLNQNTQLINTITQKITLHANEQGWAPFNVVVKDLGKEFFQPYGYSKTSDLFRQLKNIELKHDGQTLMVKKYWGIAKAMNYMNQIIQQHQNAEGWASVAKLAEQLRLESSFDAKILGFNSILDFIQQVRPQSYQLSNQPPEQMIRFIGGNAIKN